MLLDLDQDFILICKEIVHEDRKLEEWSEVESDDAFHRGRYEGGFDATEQAFCFSYYDEQGGEYWFQVSLEEVHQIAYSEQGSVNIRPAKY